jgi:CRISPR/Cas system Type II protein with McrA/HNH and RuvC-like nuclease domain
MENVLVLNSDYTPINVTSVKRGFSLVYKGKAEILKSADDPIYSGYKQYIRPIVIRLLDYVKYRIKSIKVNRSRIYKRDNYECAYCASKKTLTIDHIIPRSRGGNNTWNNLITCCHRCNVKKADRTPEEAGMVLNKKPTEPAIFSDILNSSIEELWNDLKKNMKYS